MSTWWQTNWQTAVYWNEVKNKASAVLIALQRLFTAGNGGLQTRNLSLIGLTGRR